MPHYGPWIQPEYPVRVGRYRTWVETGSGIDMSVVDIEDGAVDRDGTMHYDDDLFRSMGSRLVSSPYTSGGGQKHSFAGWELHNVDTVDATEAESNREAVLDGTSPATGTSAESLFGWEAECVFAPGDSALHVFNPYQLSQAPALLSAAVGDRTPDSVFFEPGFISYELHPDDLINGDCGEVLDAWLSLTIENASTVAFPTGYATGGASVRFKLVDPDEYDLASGEVPQYPSGVYPTHAGGGSLGAQLEGGAWYNPAPVPTGSRTAHVFEFTSLSDRHTYVKLGPGEDLDGYLGIETESDAISGKPGAWADPFDVSADAVAILATEPAFLAFAQDIVFRPPRYRVLYDGPGRLPHLRVYPRSDGYGAAPSQRLYPPPRSRQRSNRLAGGTYF